jgi:hypothetical protein
MSFSCSRPLVYGRTLAMARPSARSICALLWLGACDGDPVAPCAESAAAGWQALDLALDRIPLGVAGRPSDLWIVGGGIGPDAGSLVLRHDGARFTELVAPTPATLWWVWAGAADDVWLVGEAGTTLHWAGSALQQHALPAGLEQITLAGAWGQSPDDVWAVGGSPADPGGEQNVIVHWDGASWSRVPSGTAKPTTFFKIWGSCRDDVFAVGTLGVIVHYDGTQWAEMASGGNATLVTVHGRAPDDVWAVGTVPPTVLRFDGRQWNPVEGPFLSGVSGLHVEPGDTVWIVGFGGLKQRFSAGVWIDNGASEPIADLHAVWADGLGGAFAVGGNFTTPPAEGVRRAGVVGRLSAPSCQ